MRPEIDHRLASIGAEIARAEQALERYYAFEQGKLSPSAATSALAAPGAPRGPPSPARRTLPLDARRARPRADAGRSGSGRRPTRTRRCRKRAAEGESASPPTDPGATGRRTSADPAHLQARHARGLRNVRKSGPSWNRTNDLGIKSLDRTAARCCRKLKVPACGRVVFARHCTKLQPAETSRYSKRYSAAVRIRLPPMSTEAAKPIPADH